MFKTTVMICLSIVFIFSYSLAADNDASTIVMKVEKILSLENVKGVQEMTIHREDGTIRVYTMEIMTMGKEKTFLQILSPPREKGRQLLKLGDLVWSYLPSVKKSIRVSGRGSFMGGDFENNDVLRVNLVGDYTSEIIEELPDQYVLGLKGKDLSLSYAKIKLWVRKGDFQPIKQEYYTLSDKLIKSTSYEDIKVLGGLKKPAKMVMVSALNPKVRTILETMEFSNNVKNPSRRFRRSFLGK